MPGAQAPYPDGGEPAGPGSRTPGRVGAAGSTFLMKSPPIPGATGTWADVHSTTAPPPPNHPSGDRAAAGGGGASLYATFGAFKLSRFSTTRMKEKRLFLEKLHRSFNLDN